LGWYNAGYLIREPAERRTAKAFGTAKDAKDAKKNLRKLTLGTSD
jgi:hypothetical protein